MDSLLPAVPIFSEWFINVTPVPEWQLEASPEVYGRFLPYWAGWLLLAFHYYGLGILGLFLALRGWCRPRWNAFRALFLLLFCTVILPYPLSVLVAFFVHVDSACNLLPYTAVAPLWTAPTAIPAWLIFVAMWIYRAAAEHRKATGQSPTRP